MKIISKKEQRQNRIIEISVMCVVYPLFFIGFIYVLFFVGAGNIERYCEIHKGEGRLDCLFSENY